MSQTAKREKDGPIHARGSLAGTEFGDMKNKAPPTEYPIFEDMDDATLMSLEDDLWWIVGRKAILRVFLDRAVATRPVRRIFEIGCGSGNNFDLLSKYGRIIACDASPVQVRRARARRIAAEVFLTENCFQHTFSEPFQLTCLFDVLEHIEDDADFLAQLNRTVEPGHMVLMSVPASPSLYCSHDRLLLHYRRYRLTELDDLLASHGFRVIRSTHFVTLLFPVVAFSRLITKLRERIMGPQSQVIVGLVPRWLNRVLKAILFLEARIARTVRLPIGVWAIVLAEKVREAFPQPEYR
jgi:SAM-dependent methyltransferase